MRHQILAILLKRWLLPYHTCSSTDTPILVTFILPTYIEPSCLVDLQYEFVRYSYFQIKDTNNIFTSVTCNTDLILGILCLELRCL